MFFFIYFIQCGCEFNSYTISMMSLNPLKQVVVKDPKAQLDKFPLKSEIRQRLVSDLNPLYQSPSSISSEPESIENGNRITNIQEMYKNSVCINFLNSMLPN